MRTHALILFVLLIFSASYGAQQTSKPSEQAETGRQQTQQERRHGSMSREDAQALREDVNRMKALVQQMESNLAFVDTSQSPLKHEFQLEIEMWRTVIGQMERRLETTAR